MFVCEYGIVWDHFARYEKELAVLVKIQAVDTSHLLSNQHIIFTTHCWAAWDGERVVLEIFWTSTHSYFGAKFTTDHQTLLASCIVGDVLHSLCISTIWPLLYGLITDRVVRYCCQNWYFRNKQQRPLTILSRKLLPAHWLEDRDDPLNCLIRELWYHKDRRLSKYWI